MKIPTKRFLLKSFIQKTWKKLSNDIKATSYYENLKKKEAEFGIPSDVPRGHMVVYVGEKLRRFIIKVSFLEHPLFHELLELAHEEYGFSGGSGLCIPCDENLFLGVICYLDSKQKQRFLTCCQL
ncbi:hypothetical protein LUZ60_016490 [Juncus effusus]|nr:hypothetical protein LUZ60_016490 [Juncus effusus]